MSTGSDSVVRECRSYSFADQDALANELNQEVCTGELIKTKPKRAYNTAKLRFFVLDGKCLSYFVDASRTQKKGEILLSSITKTEVFTDHILLETLDDKIKLMPADAANKQAHIAKWTEAFVTISRWHPKALPNVQCAEKTSFGCLVGERIIVGKRPDSAKELLVLSRALQSLPATLVIDLSSPTYSRRFPLVIATRHPQPLLMNLPNKANNICPLSWIESACTAIRQHINAGQENHVILLSDDACGPAAMVACCFEFSRTPCAVLEHLIIQFVSCTKPLGVEVRLLPTEKRFIQYFMETPSHAPKTITLISAKISPCGDHDVGGGCDPYLVVERPRYNMFAQADGTSEDWERQSTHSSGSRRDRGFSVSSTDTMLTVFSMKRSQRGAIKHVAGNESCTLTIENPVFWLEHEFRVTFFDEDLLKADDKMFSVWLHARFIDMSKGRVELHLEDLDDVNPAIYPNGLTVTLEFEQRL